MVGPTDLWQRDLGLVLNPILSGTPIYADACDRTATVTTCGRICFNRRKINLSVVLAGQSVGIEQVSDEIWPVSFMDYDLGYFDFTHRPKELRISPKLH